MDEQWVEFSGKAIDNDAVWLLETHDGDGAIIVSKEDARILGERVEVRFGAIAKVLKCSRAGGRPASIDVPIDFCPNGRTRCIGFVMICCENDRIIGSGLGYWNECP